MITHILLSLRFRYEHYESKGALFRAMNADFLQMTLDKRLMKLFIEVVRVVADIFNVDVDDLFKRVLNKPEAEDLLFRFGENLLNETG